MSLEEVQFLYEHTGGQSLENYVTFQGHSNGDFGTIVQKCLSPPAKAQEFMDNCRELWLECNVLRRAGMYVRQTFADFISKADLCDNFNEQSKIARNMLLIDCL